MILAILKPEIREITGIEYDPLLYEGSRKVLKEAAAAGLVSPNQVQFYRGDFNDAPFAHFFKEADLVYYYHMGTQRTDLLARTLLENLRPGTRAVCFSHQPDPFPFLSKDPRFHHQATVPVPYYHRLRP